MPEQAQVELVARVERLRRRVDFLEERVAELSELVAAGERRQQELSRSLASNSGALDPASRDAAP